MYEFLVERFIGSAQNVNNFLKNLLEGALVKVGHITAGIDLVLGVDLHDPLFKIDTPAFLQSHIIQNLS